MTLEKCKLAGWHINNCKQKDKKLSEEESSKAVILL